MKAKVTHHQKFWVEDLKQFLRDNEIKMTDEEMRSFEAGDRVAVGEGTSVFEVEIVR